MKNKLPSAILLCLCVSFPAYAAKFVVPEAFEFLALDGQEVKRPILRRISSLELSEGGHKIALRYADTVKDSNMRYPDYLRSKPIVLTLTAEGQHIYKLVPDPVAIKQPWSYMNNPIITIVRQDGGSVHYDVIPPKTVESRLVAATKIDSSENPTAAVAAADAPQVKARSAQPDTTDPTPDPAGSMLKYWWSQADEKTRHDFMNWAAEQK